MSDNLALPSFNNVRLATLRDLPRIATVAAAGFFWSPSFQFQRPYHGDFPGDTLDSYWAEYEAAILDPASVVLVAEDEWKEAEGEGVHDALRRAPMYTSGPVPRRTIIVGVSSISLKPGSCYVGQFQTACKAFASVTLCLQTGVLTKAANDVPGLRTTSNNLNRDSCSRSQNVYHAATAPAKAKYLAGRMRLSTLAVHPAYWRRGHASRLVHWCTSLADLEDVPVGISAAPMGAKLAAKAGFEERELIRIDRSAVQPPASCGNVSSAEDVELWVAVRPQVSNDVSDESAACEDSPVGYSH